MQKGIKSRLNSGNSCYHSVQNQLSPRLLSKNVQIMTYKTIIFPVVLYECETLSLTLRAKYRLRLFGKRLLRRIFWPKRDKVTGDWRKLYNEELHDLFPSPSIIRMMNLTRMRWTGKVARMGRRGMHKRYWRETRRRPSVVDSITSGTCLPAVA
jgi:hypothetical protein